MSSLLKACKNRTVTRSLIFLTERKIAIKKPPESDPQGILLPAVLSRTQMLMYGKEASNRKQ